MVGHMVTVAVIATLVKQLMQLRFNLHDLKVELCDQQTDTQEFRNNFCEKNSKHGSDQPASKSSEAGTEIKTKTRRKTEGNTESDTETKTEVDEEKNIRKEPDVVTGNEKNKNSNIEAGTATDAKEEGVADTRTKVETKVETDTVTETSNKSEQYVLDSSVWCHGHKDRICHFHNLCFNSKEDDLFMMIGNESVYENIDFVAGSILLDLSSVRNHNVHRKYVGSIPVDISGKLEINWIQETVLLFNRFKPDNLMHVLHDDILPMYLTLKLISMVDGKSCFDNTNKPETQLVFFEGWEEGEFSQLYQLFSANPILTKEILKAKGKVICFKDAYTGVSKSTVWYDYGFSKPQGPIENFQVTAREIHSLAEYVLGHLEPSDKKLPTSSGYLVLLTRKENRQILNEVDLSLEIVKKLGIKVLNLNFEMFKFSKIVKLVHGSKGIIGMHGSLLSLAVFLKPGSVLVELFPYAVNPSHYTPFKTLASIKGMGIVYKAWRNSKFENSVAHPDRPADEGGLGHLSDEDRRQIMEQTEVPPHLCCTDPSWLYHIYQDTVVDIIEVISLIESSLEESDKYFHQSDISFHPTQVKNVSCALSKNISSSDESTTWQLSVSWDIPWTVVLFDTDDVQYEMLVQDMADKSKVKSYIVDKPPLILDLVEESSYFVWIKCVLNTTLNGPFSDASQCI